MKSFRMAAGLALALGLAVAPARAQQAPPARPQLPDSVQVLVQEFQTLRERIAQVQDSALRSNPGLVEAREGVQQFVREKMVEELPTFEEEVARINALQEEAARVQAAEDTARLREIMEEGTRIQRELEMAQAATMEREDVRSRMEAFESHMVQAMVEIDPEIDAALDRMEEIAGRLRTFPQGG